MKLQFYFGRYIGKLIKILSKKVNTMINRDQKMKIHYVFLHLILL